MPVPSWKSRSMRDNTGYHTIHGIRPNDFFFENGFNPSPSPLKTAAAAFSFLLLLLLLLLFLSSSPPYNLPPDSTSVPSFWFLCLFFIFLSYLPLFIVSSILFLDFILATSVLLSLSSNWTAVVLSHRLVACLCLQDFYTLYSKRDIPEIIRHHGTFFHSLLLVACWCNSFEIRDWLILFFPTEWRLDRDFQYG